MIKKLKEAFMRYLEYWEFGLELLYNCLFQWLNNCGLIEQLIDKLSPDCDSEEHSSVDQLLQEIISSAQDIPSNVSDQSNNQSNFSLLVTLERYVANLNKIFNYDACNTFSKQIIDKLMDILLHENHNESSVSHVINVLLKLLSTQSSQEPNS